MFIIFFKYKDYLLIFLISDGELSMTTENESSQKKQYFRPKLIILGKITVVTQKSGITPDLGINFPNKKPSAPKEGSL